MSSLTSHVGFSVLMALFGLLLLGGVATTTLSIVSTTQDERANTVASDAAHAAAQAGIEYAKNRINLGVNPVATNVAIGQGTFTIAADPNSGGLIVTGQAGNAKRTYTLTTNFAKQCVDLDVAAAHSAGRNLVDIKLRKTCLAKATITDWLVAWEPNLQERTTRLQVTGYQLVTLYENTQGYPSGQKIDATDFTLTRNDGVYPVNKIEFANPLPPCKTYTVGLFLGDGSVITKSFRDPGACNGSTSGGGGNPAGSGQGFEVRNSGDVVVAPSKNVRVDALCAEITFGAGGPPIPVKAWIGATTATSPKTYIPLFAGTAIHGGEQHVVASGATGTTYAIKANAQYGSFNATYTSNDTAQVKTLVNGAQPPPLAGFGGQQAVSQCVRPYLNVSTGRVQLNANQSILLFELGVNMSQNPNSPAADFQDLVVLLTMN